MKRGPTGALVAGPTLGGETVRAFVPEPLPPTPALVIDAKLREEIDRALLALGRLDSVSAQLPDTSLFLYTYVRKEAVLSSQIEGTQSSLSDLLLFEIEEAPGVPFDDVAAPGRLAEVSRSSRNHNRRTPSPRSRSSCRSVQYTCGRIRRIGR